jgi:hypothetical protein
VDGEAQVAPGVGVPVARAHRRHLRVRPGAHPPCPSPANPSPYLQYSPSDSSVIRSRASVWIWLLRIRRPYICSESLIC